MKILIIIKNKWIWLIIFYKKEEFHLKCQQELEII